MFVTCVATLAVFQGVAHAQSYPGKPVRIVVPFPPSGFSDTVARLVGQRLSEALGQPVVNDNRPGATGTIGEDLVAKAAPDGYTLLTVSLNFVVKPGISRLPFDTLKDFAPVGLIATGPPLVIAVSASSAYKSLQDFIAAAKTSPGQLTFASAGPGSSGHLAAELLKSTTGISLVQVPYKGSVLGVTATVSGEVTANASYVPVALPLIRAGRMRALGVTAEKRSASLPEVPTMLEAGFAGFEIGGMAGLAAPARTARPVIERLNRELNAIGAQRDFVERLESQGMQSAGGTPEAFGRFLREQTERWTRVMRNAGIKPQP
jgi:tripartite-type tricarboxylate transporter receptor subunit TctC